MQMVDHARARRRAEVHADVHPLRAQLLLEQRERSSERLGEVRVLACVHPRQVPLAHAAFTPTAEEVDYCRRVVQAFDGARARGEGAIAFGGQLLDMPIVDRARQTIALAESLRS